ncbi:MAG: hypothetical protein OEV65_14490 [Aquincola sp.]|nr:hypothetical protein [Aquincola sp.]MDH5351637.1 hypothetical protein [Betaproteobacteria bacterium]
MSLQDLGSIGNLIGAIAVVVSLVYLAIQVRQNTRAVRASTERAIFAQNMDFDRMVVSDPELNRIWILGRSKPDQLTEEQARRFRRLMSMYYRHFEDLYFQHQDALVGNRVFDAWRTIGMELSRQPGAVLWWERYSGVLTEEFRHFVEQGRAGHPGATADVVQP